MPIFLYVFLFAACTACALPQSNSSPTSVAPGGDSEKNSSTSYRDTLRVGKHQQYRNIGNALASVRQMKRHKDQRVIIMVEPGNYEEMLRIDEPFVSIINASKSPSIGLKNSGVDIDDGAVRITGYYGHGYTYYSMAADQQWNKDTLQSNLRSGFPSQDNKGGKDKQRSYWNATVLVTADGFIAKNIIFENSFNQYISRKEAEDIVVEWKEGGRGLRPRDYRNTEVQYRDFVERAAAIAIAEGADKILLDQCRIIGRQDTFFGGHGSRVVIYRGSVMGGVDYIFGGMTAVFYQTELTMNTSPKATDRSYITAAQQRGERGYLMYECTINSATPGTETASPTGSKPGYFGRPWEATTSEVVFYNTTIDTSGFPGYEGQSLIKPLGWRNTLRGESAGMYEYGTREMAGVDNLPDRAGWATKLTHPTLHDGTEITPYNFTKGTDGWDPWPELFGN